MSIVFNELAELIKNSRLEETSGYIQHGDTSCLLHTVAVAYYSVKLAEALGIKCKKEDLIRGALLHDYFLYDWHDGARERRLHGFTHPAAALKNADRDFMLSFTERDIIIKHMFPLTIIPPICRESWIVCCVDKMCSFYEAFARETYPVLRYVLKENHIKYRR